jgi:hypothetical protein
MLDVLGVVLADLGLRTATAATPEVNINWSHHISVEVKVGGAIRFYVKLAPAAERSLANEAETLKLIAGPLHGHAPELLGHVVKDGLTFVVMAFVETRPVARLEDIVGDPGRLGYWRHIFGTFRNLRGGEAPGDRQRIAEHMCRSSPALAAYVDRCALAPVIAALPSVPQHCDLVTNNIGEIGGRPVIYDWEDFGRVDLPGFDLALFLGTLLELDPARIAALLQAPRRLDPGLASLIEATGLAGEEFCRLMPVYYGAFLWLKETQGYRSNIRDLTLNVIDMLAASEPLMVAKIP